MEGVGSCLITGLPSRAQQQNVKISKFGSRYKKFYADHGLVAELLIRLPKLHPLLFLTREANYFH